MAALGEVKAQLEVKTPLKGGGLLAFWAYLGVFALLGQAIYRLTPLALEPLGPPNRLGHLAWLYWGWVVANVYLEGYRGFHLRFVPRVARRVELLLTEPTLLRIALAPLYVMGYFDSPQADKRAAYGVTLAVVFAVVVVRTFEQPWRGIVDAGVVAGLGAGTLSLAWAAFRGRVPAS
jgi:hypothetical protein